MRRHILGIALLVLLPILGFLSARQLSDHCRQLGDQLHYTAQLFIQNEDEAAYTALQQAARQWDEKRHFSAAFIHHTPLNEVDRDFAAAKIAQDDLAESCARLAQQLYTIADSNRLSWWDVL